MPLYLKWRCFPKEKLDDVHEIVVKLPIAVGVCRIFSAECADTLLIIIFLSTISYEIDVPFDLWYYITVNDLCVLQCSLHRHTLLFLYFVPVMPLTVWSAHCGHFLSAGGMPRVK